VDRGMSQKENITSEVTLEAIYKELKKLRKKVKKLKHAIRMKK
jgi:hypothetical protein